jgi:hypothetical protein
MDTLVAFCKKIRLGKVFTIFAAGFILLLNVACSNGSTVGARPNNPPVQMGGQNNPHKAGGDGYSQYQMSTDPAVEKRDRAGASGFDQLIATTNGMVDHSVSAQNNQVMETTQVRGGVTRDPMKEAKQIPEKPQEVIDRSDPNAKILEKSTQAFKEASKHLNGSTDQSID